MLFCVKFFTYLCLFLPTNYFFGGVTAAPHVTTYVSNKHVATAGSLIDGSMERQ